MSEGDPFRDDGDAAVARAEALAAELERTQRERDELAAKLAAASDKAAKFDALEADKRRAVERELEKEVAQREAVERAKERARKRGLSAEQMADRRNKLLGGAIGGGVLVGIVLVMVIPGYLQAKEHRAWLVAKAARERAFAEWDAMLDMQRCLHDRETKIAGIERIARDPDPRREGHDPRVYWNYDPHCGKALDVLSHTRELPGEARAACTRWNVAMTAAEAPLDALRSYYDQRDWKDDAYASGPAKWADAQERLAEVAQAVDAVRTLVLPLVRARIAQLGETLPTEKRARVAFGLKVDRVADLVHLLDLGKPTDGDLAAEAKAILDAGASAPLEIRRVLRSTSTLENLANNTYRNAPSSYEMWDAVDDEATAPIPPLAAEPSMGCDGGD